jgi:hypothetical protein
MLIPADGRLSTLTSRSIFFRADIQKMKSPSDYGEFRQSHEASDAPITGSPHRHAAAAIAGS